VLTGFAYNSKFVILNKVDVLRDRRPSPGAVDPDGITFGGTEFSFDIFLQGEQWLLDIHTTYIMVKDSIMERLNKRP
jgi:hypothetical protein